MENLKDCFQPAKDAAQAILWQIMEIAIHVDIAASQDIK